MTSGSPANGGRVQGHRVVGLYRPGGGWTFGTKCSGVAYPLVRILMWVCTPYADYLPT